MGVLNSETLVIKSLEADSNITASSHTTKINTICPAGCQLITAIDTDKKVFPDVVINTRAKLNAWRKNGNGFSGWAHDMNCQTCRNNPGSQFGAFEKLDFG